jgi:16S rRNA (cytosine967-C5)-methyltransferase
MHFAVHQNIADNLVSAYDGSEPLANYLKKYFAANKKHGSKDRKNITALCYAHFRNNANSFPLLEDISPEIEAATFIASHKEQPLLFVRVRPWQKETVIAKLNASAIAYEMIGEEALSFTNTTAIQDVLDINKEVVIQDLSSQALANLLKHIPIKQGKPMMVWDACAASGGKTILLFDFLSNINIHISDIRTTILVNAEKRLNEAGIRPASVQVIDLTEPFEIKKQFDMVLADVPCSGSGTWGRTPEQLAFFNQAQLNKYTQLQNKIVQNLIPAVAIGGYLLYATCSVYKAENENRIEAIMATGQFKLIEQSYYKGYTHKADTLFGALLQKIR